MNTTNPSDPQPILPFIDRQILSNSMNSIPLYSDWMWNTFSKRSYDQITTPLFVPPILIKHIYLILSSPFVAKTIDFSQVTCFWTKLSNFNEDTINNLRQIVKKQIKNISNTIGSNIFINSDVNSVVYYTSSMRNMPEAQRVILQYIGFDSANTNPTTLTFYDGKTEANVELQFLLKKISKPLLLIIEKDRAGAILPILEKFIHNSPRSNIIAFFSCMENQNMPKSNNLPNDLFNACLSTPSQIALLWHSRHYFCFHNGPLQPLSPNFINEESTSHFDSTFNQISQSLKSIVHSIALKCLGVEKFTDLFLFDPVLSKLFVNFVLACRILGNFNVNPLSYPSIPDMSSFPEWHSFDMILDSALLSLHSPSIPKGMSQIINVEHCHKSLKNSLLIYRYRKQIPLEFSFIPIIISNPRICEEICEILSPYIDQSQDLISSLISFSFLPSLLKMLNQITISKHVLFCIMKILSYDPHQINVNTEQLYTFVDCHLDTFLYTEKQPVEKRLSMIILILIIKNFRQPLRNKKYKKEIFSKMFPVWTLHLIASLVPSINEPSILWDYFNTATEFSNLNEIEVQICLIHCLSSFIFNNDFRGMKRNVSSESIAAQGQIEEKAIMEVLHYSNSISHIIRIEVLLVVSSYFHSHSLSWSDPIPEDIISDHLHSFFEKCLNDPHPSINELAIRIQQSLDENQPSLSSHVLFDYLKTLKSPVIKLLEPELPRLSQILQPKDSISISNVSIEKFIIPKARFGPIIPFRVDFSSNILPFEDSYIVANHEGVLLKNKWLDIAQAKTATVVSNPITCIKHMVNSGNPLLFSLTNNGRCYVNSMNDDFSLPLINSFSIPLKISDLHNRIEINSISKHLYAYSESGTEFFMYDLVSSKLDSIIQAPNGISQCLKPLSHHSDLIAIAGEHFCIKDLRDSNREPLFKVELETSVFAFDCIDPLVPIFSICDKSLSVSYVDFRFPQGFKTMKAFTDFDATTTCFSTQTSISTAAIGFNDGIRRINLINAYQEAIPNIPIAFAISKAIRPSSIAFHPHQNSFVCVHDNNTIVTVI